MMKQLMTCFGIGCVTLFALARQSEAQLTAHWTFDQPTPNVSPWTNSVPGGAAMVHDPATAAPADFDPEQVRLETGGDPKTRLFTSSAPVGNTFSVSMIIDPTDLFGFGPILAKESDETNGADFAHVGWAIQPVPGGFEFIVRGSNIAPNGSNDFFGVIPLNNVQTLVPFGPNFDNPNRWQFAAGYDATSGNAYFYINKVDAGLVTSLVGSTATFTPGATQDSTPISIGSYSRIGSNGSPQYVNGSGFDVDDLQFYNRLLSPNEVLFLANHPGTAIPEPSSVLMLGLGAVLLAARRRRA